MIRSVLVNTTMNNCHIRKKCSTCDYKTRHKCNLIRHLLIHRPPTNNTVNNKTANSNNYTCEHCGYETTVVARFQRHILKHGKYNLKCDECDYETYRIDALKNHMLIHTKFFKCDQCGYTAKRKNSLKRHLLSHNNVHKEETKHKCYICDYSSKYKSGLEKHLWTHGIYDKTKNIYKCEQCNYTSFFKENLPRHMLSHNSAKKEKKFECEHCDYKTHRKDCLRLHSHIHQEDKMKNCSICNGRYTAYQLKRHMLSHGALSGKNSNIVYKCEQCDYRSFRKDQLNTHLQSHDALGVNKKYVCDKCDYKTYSNAKLKRHMLVHAKTRDNKNFKCKQCDYETYRKDYLTNHHRLKHKAGVEHKCSVCNYSSKWISYVERHMLKHGIVSEKMKKNSFECEHCGYKSYVKQNFKGHMRKHDKTKCI
ncbi:unnamed protein product [Callosobruchus maculatus]|uniref:C2H2-type domain-containing protein n=1 Tax=Callosobruchus maculatus TaxID=64391 RepID=A0A653C6H6_CALMS|nr:unnamed protein product [Callosobruchus maculatus]